MKKIIFSLLAMFLIGNLYSQTSGKALILTEIASDDDLEYEKFLYNNKHQMVEKKVLYSDGIEAKELYHYENDQVVKVDGHQLLDDEWTMVYYIEYTYDSAGNRLSRKNYNRLGSGDIILSGIFEYEHENNRCVRWSLTMMDELMEVCELTYDSEGRLVEELGKDAWTTSQLLDAWKMTYTYNEDGSLNEARHTYVEGGQWIEYTADLFFYDENGNCSKWDHYFDGVVANRYEYEYDLDYTREEVVMPYSPEDDAHPFRLVEYQNKLELSHWYMQDNNGELMYICDFLYKYSPLDPVGTTAAHISTTDLSVFPNPAMQELTVMSDQKGIQKIKITDMAGNTVLTMAADSGNRVQVDVSELNPGVYVLQSLSGRGISTKKIMVK